MDLDWRLSHVPKITNTAGNFAIKGIFYQEGHEHDETNITTEVKMPYSDSEIQSKFQVFITNYTINSLGGLFLKVHPINFMVYGTDEPEFLKTEQIGSIIPQILDKYGKGHFIDVESNMLKLSDFKIRENDNTISCLVDVDIDFWVETNQTNSTTGKDKMLSI